MLRDFVRRSTTLRVSLGVVSTTLSLLLIADLIGVLPDTTEAKLEVRKKTVELVAVQVASAATRNDVGMVGTILSGIVERDEKVVSAALRRRGVAMAIAGPHEEFWKQGADSASTPTHVQVPIMKNATEWGVVELRFKPLQDVALANWRESPLAIFGFVALVGFACYFLFLRRVLAELDPSSVVPEHVRSAFNALAEGVIIVDEDERIVLANQKFADMMGRPVAGLMGVIASDLRWKPKTGETIEAHPWQMAMEERKAQTGVLLRRRINRTNRHFVVNSSPILDGKGRTRGALATFDDVSEIEKMNDDLNQSRNAIQVKNNELQFLATRDPLTSLLNRRSLFELFEEGFTEAKRSGVPLSGLMIDIDLFKSVNDRHGHNVGDLVIQFVAKQIELVAETGHLAGRYGGEEFCLIMPGSDIEDAAALAERLRANVNEAFRKNLSWDFDVTISVGVASSQGALDTTVALLNRADEALYAAKANGRNCVVKWDGSKTAATRKAEELQRESEVPVLRTKMSARS